MTVSPDFRGFHEKVKAELQGIDGDAAKAGEKSGARFSRGFGDRLKLLRAKVRVGADTADARAKIDRVARDRRAKVKLDVSWLRPSPLSLGALAAAALGPQLLGIGAGAAGAGVAFGAAAANVGAFAAVAVPEIRKVAGAQQALAKAQAAYAAASAKAQKKSALAAEAKALASLTPAEKAFAKELGGVESAWRGVRKASEPVVAKSLAPWLQAATYGMRWLGPAVKDAGGAVRFLGQEAQTALKAPFWGKFFGTLRQTGSAALMGFGDALGHVASGFAHLFVKFAPDIQKLPGLIDKWAKSFDNWASHVKRSGFDRFMSRTFSSANVATLKGDLRDLGKVLGNVAKATSQLSPAAFGGLSNVLTVLSKLTPTQIEAIGALYAVSRTAGGVGNLASLAGIGGKAAEKKAGGSAFKDALGAGAAGVSLVGAGIAAAFLYGLSKVHNVNGSTWVSQGPGGKQGGWNNFGQAGKNLKNWFWSSPGNWAKTGWSEAYTHFQRDFAGKVTAWFTQSLPHAFAATRGTLARAGTNMGHWLGTGWDHSGGWLVSQFGHAGHWAVHALSSSGHWLKGAGQRAAGGLISGWNHLSRWVKFAFASAQNWITWPFRSAGSWLKSAGYAVLHGLLQGMQAAWKPVSSFLGWVTALIPKIKGPMARDRRLLYPNGMAIMAGLADGMRAGLPQVHALARSVAPSLAATSLARPAAAGPLRLAVSYAGSGSDVVDAIVSGLRFHVQSTTGGDVQAALGQGAVR